MRMNVRTTYRCQHGEAFSKSTDVADNCLRILREMFDLSRDFLCRTGCTVADVMKFMRQRIFKLLFIDGRVQVEKNRRVSGKIEHETILTRFDDWIDLSVDVCRLRQVCECQMRCVCSISSLPGFQGFR